MQTRPLPKLDCPREGTYNLVEVADVFGVTRAAVLGWIRAGLLKAIEQGDDRVLVVEGYEMERFSHSHSRVNSRAYPYWWTRPENNWRDREAVTDEDIIGTLCELLQGIEACVPDHTPVGVRP